MNLLPELHELVEVLGDRLERSRNVATGNAPVGFADSEASVIAQEDDDLAIWADRVNVARPVVVGPNR